MHLIWTRIDAPFRPKKSTFQRKELCLQGLTWGLTRYQLDWQEGFEPNTSLWLTVHVSGNNWHRCHRGYHDNEDLCAHHLKNWHTTNRGTSASTFLPWGCDGVSGSIYYNENVAKWHICRLMTSVLCLCSFETSQPAHNESPFCWHLTFCPLYSFPS